MILVLGFLWSTVEMQLPFLFSLLRIWRGDYVLGERVGERERELK